jgi:hypothetical protein
MNNYLDFQRFAANFAANNPASNLYFLLDHGGLPGLHRQLLSTSASWGSLFSGTNETNSLEVAPILVLAGSDGVVHVPFVLSKWISENGTYSSSVMMLSSPLDLEQLRGRLATRLNVRLSGNMDAMLRFFDPRVFQALIEVLDVEQVNVFLSPAQRWWYVDRRGIVKDIEGTFSDAVCMDAPLVLSASQEFRLIDSCEVDQVLRSLRENAPNLIRKLDFALQYDFVVSNINEAKGVGLKSLDDLVLYNVVVLTMGSRFLSEDKWSNLINAVRLDPSRFSELVVCLEDGALDGELK